MKAYRSRRLKEDAVDDRELVEALERARLQQEELAAIVERLEALRRL